MEVSDNWEERDEDEIFKKSEWMGRAVKYREKPEFRTHIFGSDKENTKGKIWFEATSGAWRRYVFSFAEDSLNSYAVIREDEPVFCFMDVEFQKSENPNHYMEQMVQTLFQHFFKVWEEYFPKLEISLSDFLVLTASSDSKESRHIHGPFNYAFKHVYHVKAFISTVIESIQRGIQMKDKDCIQCLIKKKKKGRYKINEKDEPSRKSKTNSENSFEELFIDLNVYNHLASMRMYMCTKRGEMRPLVVDKNYKLPSVISNMKGSNDNEKLFKLTIMHAVPPNIKILEFPNDSVVQSVLPKLAFKRKSPESIKLSFFIFKFPEYKDSNDELICLQNSTHVEVRDKKSYRIINDLQQLYKLMSEKNAFYSTVEIISEKTIFLIELQPPTVDQFPDTIFLNNLQTILNEAFPKKIKKNCLLLRLSDQWFRFVWPFYELTMNEGNLLSSKIESLLKDMHQSINTTNVYTRRYVSMLDSVCGGEKICSFVQEITFNEESEEFQNKTKRELLHILSVRKK